MPRQSSPHRQPPPAAPPVQTVPSATSLRPAPTGTEPASFSTKPARKRCLNEGAHKLSY